MRHKRVRGFGRTVNIIDSTRSSMVVVKTPEKVASDNKDLNPQMKVSEIKDNPLLKKLIKHTSSKQQ